MPQNKQLVKNGNLVKIATTVAGCVLLLCLPGCSSVGGMFGKKSDKNPSADQTPPPPDGKEPYNLAAEANGQVINFAVANHTSTELPLAPESFALIPEGTRQVIPYDPANVTIDVAGSVSPGQTVMGRAIFRDFPNAMGSRLVFKPDNRGTFAQILPSGSFRPAGTGNPPAPKN
ncbi:MAG: hypothetical protein K1X53_17355 [Candidatus Sumerlaeaceae bacterium]|nr:hypothetical protein [Candidatus Sumerlaeaceae bacterium]